MAEMNRQKLRVFFEDLLFVEAPPIADNGINSTIRFTVIAHFGDGEKVETSTEESIDRRNSEGPGLHPLKSGFVYLDVMAKKVTRLQVKFSSTDGFPNYDFEEEAPTNSVRNEWLHDRQFFRHHCLTLARESQKVLITFRSDVLIQDQSPIEITPENKRFLKTYFVGTERRNAGQAIDSRAELILELSKGGGIVYSDAIATRSISYDASEAGSRWFKFRSPPMPSLTIEYDISDPPDGLAFRTVIDGRENRRLITRPMDFKASEAKTVDDTTRSYLGREPMYFRVVATIDKSEPGEFDPGDEYM